MTLLPVHLGVDVWTTGGWPTYDGPLNVLARTACGFVLSTSFLLDQATVNRVVTMHGPEVTCEKCLVRMDSGFEGADMLKMAL